ncbi:9954_t:CDS:2 [Acaulospora morrowiae]|uniref:Transcription initiation factor TFIID subunit 4 n=1 Tax=Acaulospora morrowiae TaxID=94023 RepID=A0A9N9BGK5_9GLOM|nr:9954_t:CDS:2 [Acaulospora morrowiae]
MYFDTQKEETNKSPPSAGTSHSIPNMQGTTPLNRPDQGAQIPRGRTMGPPPQPPMGYRSAIYGSPVPRMEMPRTNGNMPNGGSIPSRRATAPASTTLISDEKPNEKTSYENDVLAYSGVDLKAEENNIRREYELLTSRHSTTSIQQPDRSRAQSFLNHKILAAKVQSIALQHKISNAHPDALTYLALATQERIRELVETMITAKNHRIHSERINLPPVTDGKPPMYKEIVSLDVRSQLAAMEKVEREQERRRREQLAGPSQESNVDDEKMEDFTTESIAKSTNQTALVAAGGLTKSWMLPQKDVSSFVSTSNGVSSSNSKLSRVRARLTSDVRNVPMKLEDSNESSRNAQIISSYHTPERFNGLGRYQPNGGNEVVPTVTVKDALFVLERDRGGGGQAGGSREVLMKGYVKWLR